ncbi:transmembrane protein 255B [Scomber scombrus]|uniref:transmembrane protein 255B n=1 Tax=Scomber scombrus TaxID=13677 RepID=UPI002DDC6A56|nr:transmembrane protein 255B [Scomber scombrus]
MQQPETQQTTQQTTTEILDPAVQYLRRRKTALWVTVALLALALVVLAVGLVSATRTDNVPVAGYYPGITLSFGAFLGIVGIHLVENRRPMLMAAIIFVSIGVIASFFCAIVDGIIASEFIDTRPLQEDMCDFYASGSGYAYDSYYTEVSLKHTILGAYKDMQKPTPQMAPSPAPPPHILYNPTQHMLTYAGFCPSGQTLPAYPNYPIAMQHNSNYQTPATPQMIPDGGPGSTSCPSEENQNQQPCQTPNQLQPQGGTQEPGGYMLTPNAPVLFGSSYSPFEKPPPYAC